MQLPLIMSGHSYRAFTKLLALGTQKEEDERYRRSTGATGLQRARSRGNGPTIYCTAVKKHCFWVNIYLMLRVHNKQSMCASIYNIQYLSIHVYNHIYICTV